MNDLNSIINTVPSVTFVPEYDPVGYDRMRAFFLEGAEMRGKRTRAFGYIGFPEEIGDTPIPAVVLVHGGGGYAFPGWIKMWCDRGYAAIALCNTGHRPKDGGITDFTSAASWVRDDDPSEVVSPPDNDSMKNSGGPLDAQWMYHAVYTTILAHNMLRQDARVERDKIGIVGISWGSVITVNTIIRDHRFAFAVPIYGSGYLDRGIGWIAPLFTDEATKALWNPTDELSTLDMPILWLCWANDPAFSIVPNVLSAKAAKRSYLSIKHDFTHSHPEGESAPETFRFADSIVKKGRGIPRVVTQPFREVPGDRRISITVDFPKDSTENRARLLYITEPMTYSENGVIAWNGCPTIDQTWQILDCSVTGGIVALDLPRDAVGFYIEVTSRVKKTVYTASSHYFEKRQRK